MIAKFDAKQLRQQRALPPIANGGEGELSSRLATARDRLQSKGAESGPPAVIAAISSQHIQIPAKKKAL